jgi:hypothetical protein
MTAALIGWSLAGWTLVAAGLLLATATTLTALPRPNPDPDRDPHDGWPKPTPHPGGPDGPRWSR